MEQKEFKTLFDNEPLLYGQQTLEMVKPECLNSQAGAIYYGTGLTTPKTPSIGLPFDVLIFILVAEKLRRALNFQTIFHHIADTHALTNSFCTPALVNSLANEYRQVLGRIATITRIPLQVQLSSEFDGTEDYKRLLSGVTTDKGEYVRRELTDIFWYRQNHGVNLKLGWLIQGTETELGFDERLYDREFLQKCDQTMSFAYAIAGRTLDPKRIKASPYIATDASTRILLKPDEDVRAKYESNLEMWKGDKQMGGYLKHLNAIVRLWDRLMERRPEPGIDTIERVQRIINEIFSEG